MAKAVQNLESQVPAELLNEMAADSGHGQEGITGQDLAIPFLKILQQMSPELAKRDGKFIDGAEEGMIMNTVTGKLWKADEGVTVIPCGFKFKIIEWKPERGGLVQQYSRTDTLPAFDRNEKGQAITPEGNILSDTAEHYVLVVHSNGDGTAEQALISMSSTQLKHSRKWNTMIKQKIIQTKDGPKSPPSYGFMYNLQTTGESKDDNHWEGWAISDAGMVTDSDLYQGAKAFASSINQNEDLVKHTPAEEVM